MNKLLFLFAFIYSNILFSQSIDAIEIKSTEIPAKYIFLKKLESQTTQSKLLYKNPEVYSFILGKILHKKFQTFEYDGKKGSILYFEFDKSTSNAKEYIEGLLWHGKKPTKLYPEKVITKGKIMIVSSFPFKSEIGKNLTELVNQKL